MKSFRRRGHRLRQSGFSWTVRIINIDFAPKGAHRNCARKASTKRTGVQFSQRPEPMGRARRSPRTMSGERNHHATAWISARRRTHTTCARSYRRSLSNRAPRLRLGRVDTGKYREGNGESKCKDRRRICARSHLRRQVSTFMRAPPRT